MSTQQAVQTAPRATLATLLVLIEKDQTLTEGNRREMRSAINTVGKVLHLDPHMVPTTASELRALLNGALPRAAGVSDARWRNATSLLRRAIALLDPAAIPARSKSVLLPEWAELLNALSVKRMHIRLARFARYCSANSITPHAVTQEIYDRFYDDLVAHGLMRSPRETQQAAGNAWNKARQTVPAWPDVTLTMRNFRRNPSLLWTTFPESLRADVNAYLTPRSADLFDLTNDAPPMRASTIAGKLIQLRQFATALVESGRDVASIRSLADLIQVDAARAGLEVLMQRSDQRKTTRNHTMAYLLLSVARHWVKADEATLARSGGS